MDDALAFHREQWFAELYDPAGGRYVWDAEWGTYASTVAGHPGVPASPETIGTPPLLEFFNGARVDMSFENDGLRVRAQLARER